MIVERAFRQRFNVGRSRGLCAHPHAAYMSQPCLSPTGPPSWLSICQSHTQFSCSGFHIFTFTPPHSPSAVGPRQKTAHPSLWQKHERAQFVHVRVGTAQRHPTNDRAAGCDPSKFAPREPGRLGVQPILCRAACPTQRPLGEARGYSSTRAQRALWHLSASARAAWRDAQAPSRTRWGARTTRGCSRGRA